MFSPAQFTSSESNNCPTTNDTENAPVVAQSEFDFYYRRLNLVFNGDKEAAKAAAERLRVKLDDTEVAQEATGASLTLKVCELYGEYGPDVEAAREAYQQQRQKGEQNDE